MNAVLAQTTAEEMSDQERELHITACGLHLVAAYARFQAFGNPHDRDEAVYWQHLQQEAIKARSEAQKLRMEQVIDEGLDYFSTEGERARRMQHARGLS